MSTIQTFANTIQRGALIVMDGQNASIVFKFPINPSSFTDSHSANYVDHAVVGRSHPRSQWINSTAREIGFTLDLDSRNESFRFTKVGVVFRGSPDDPSDLTTGTLAGIPTIQKATGTAHSLIVATNFLRSLTKPRVFQRQSSNEAEIFAAPPKVLFVWGRFFRVRCIVRSVSTNWLSFDPQLTPTRAKVTIKLHEQPLAPQSWREYLNAGDTKEPLDVMEATA